MKKRLFNMAINLRNRVHDAINNEKGFSVVMTLLFTGILVLAVIAMQTDITDTFTYIANKFKTWIQGKIDAVMS